MPCKGTFMDNIPKGSINNREKYKSKSCTFFDNVLLFSYGVIYVHGGASQLTREKGGGANDSF